MTEVVLLVAWVLVLVPIVAIGGLVVWLRWRSEREDARVEALIRAAYRFGDDRRTE